MNPTTDDCDGCRPSNGHFGPKAAFSTVPFITTFAITTLVAYRKVYPLLAAPGSTVSTASPSSSSSKSTLPVPSSYHEPSTQTLIRRAAALTFSSTIALSAVLTELLLCEISNSFNPTARSVALQVTVVSLLGLLVVAIPLLGIHTVVTSSGQRIKNASTRKRRLAWFVEAVGYALFLGAFWALGALLPPATPTYEVATKGLNLFQACLDRLGITGVTLMALLSGFASVSAIWQNFGPKASLVAENDIARKQTGYDATLEMIAEKKQRLSNLQRRMTDAPNANAGFWARAAGSLLPLSKSSDTAEKQTLEMEISGLETMASSLESSLSVLRGRRADQLKEKTTIGRIQLGFGFAFACYCVYRIAATSINIFRRVVLSRNIKSETDPVTYGIALFARHVYPSLDQASWAHQISFLLSGAMLLASFNAVTQTFYLFARLMPGVLHATRTNFALLISQVSGMYVISSALMLRGMMPEKVGGVINIALGAGLLDPTWVQRWFEGWFLLAVSVTAVGIGVTRSWRWEDDTGWDRDIEMKGA